MTHETVCSFVDWRTSRPFLPRVLLEARKPQKPVDSTRPIWMLLHKLKVVGCVLHVFFFAGSGLFRMLRQRTRKLNWVSDPDGTLQVSF